MKGLLKKLFTDFDKPVPVKEYLAKDEVKKTVEDFIENNLASTNAVIIIYGDNKAFDVKTAGLSLDETINCLGNMEFLLRHERVK